MAVSKRKRKSQPYQAEVFVSGVRVATRCFDTRAEAHKWHDDTKKRYESGRGPVGQMSLWDVISTYRARHLPGLATSTQDRCRRVLDFLETSPVSGVSMADFGDQTVTSLLDWMLSHERASVSCRYSFDKEVKVLAQVLTYYREEHDASFVVPVTRRHKRRSKFRPAKKRPRDYYIPQDKVGPWLEALKRHLDPVYADVALCQLVLGARVGEIAALKWDAVDLERRQVRIERTMDWVDGAGKSSADIADRTKTAESRRTLPLPEVLVSMLKAARRRHPFAAEVFLNRWGRKLYDQSIRYHYRLAFEEVGLDWTGTHICRHTNATFAMVGGTLAETGMNLGHTSEAETRRYAKIYAMQRNTVPERVAQMILDGQNLDHVQNHVQDTEAGG